MYGTLEAASEFQDTFNYTLSECIMMSQGMSSPCFFQNEEKDLKIVYHGDDIGAVSTGEVLREFHEDLRNYFDAEIKYLLGPEPTDDKEGRLLNRCLTWRDDGLLWEADPRHAELIIAELGLIHAKAAATPGLRLRHEDHDNAEPLSGEATSAYRRTAARAGFLAMDRFELLFPSKECLRGMSKPTTAHVRMLKRIGRFLIGKPRVGILYQFQRKGSYVDSIGDTDYNQCPISRKSTNGGVVMTGKHCLTAWSTTQQLPSLSIGEAEWYGVNKTSAEGLGVKAGCQDLGDEYHLRVWTDSSAAIGIGNRLGLGKLKHVETQYLWVQHARKQNRPSLHKEEGKNNCADNDDEAVIMARIAEAHGQSVVR